MSSTGSCVDSFDLVESMFEYIKKEDTTMETFLKEHGGTNIYIPSFKSTFRDKKICEAYEKDMSKKNVLKLARDYDLSEQQIYKITKHLREPSLFN